MKTLNRRITAIFLLYSLIIVLLVWVGAKVFIKREFNNYIEDSIKTRKTEIVNGISKGYRNGKWDNDYIEQIGMNALENGMLIKINNSINQEVWNAWTHNNGMCQSILNNINENMYKVNQKFSGEYVTETIDIKSNNIIVGTMEIEYYGPYYYLDVDIIYFKTLNNILGIVSVIFIFLSVIMGILISRTISRPINKVINSTNLIAKGKYSDRITYNSKILEMDNLINSVNIMAEKLEKQDEFRNNLTKDVYHEIKTPITIVSSHLEAIVDGVWQPTEDRISSIYEEIQRLSRLIKSMETLSYFDEEKIKDKLHIQSINIEELIKNIVYNFEKELLDKNISLKLNISSCIIKGDKDKLSQAIINILSNSIKYSSEKGNIEIWNKVENNEVLIGIKDDGIGISENHLPYIFDRFYRIDKSRDRLTGGYGIGLAITYGIIKAHGGTIKAYSKPLEGSEFIIKLIK